MIKKANSKTEYEYCIENVESIDVFDAQCKMLEQGLLDLQKDELFIADDGAPTQYYTYRGMEIFVLYDTGLGEIYVHSPIDIHEHILKP